MVAAVAIFVCAAVYLNWSYGKEEQVGKNLGDSTLVNQQDPLVGQQTGDVGTGGERTAQETVTLGRGSGGQSVVPLQTMEPEFRGALIVCPGGGDPQVRLALLKAVSALTGLGADRVCICESAR